MRDYSIICLLFLCSIFSLGSGCTDGGGSAADAGRWDVGSRHDVGQDALDANDIDATDADATSEDTADAADAGVAPIAYRIMPGWGIIDGGTRVRMRGRGFVDAMRVRLAGVPVEELQVLDDRTAEFTTPSVAGMRQGGLAPVELVIDGEVRFSAPLFRYMYLTQVEGSPIDGSMTVRVVSDNALLLAGAHVKLVGTSLTGTGHVGTTGADGLVTFSGSDIMGPQSVAAVAPGHSSALFQDVERDQLTLVLHQPDNTGAPPPPPTATLQGAVSGMDRLPEPGPNQSKMVVVRTSIACVVCVTPEPGPNNSLTASDGTYELNSRTGELAVYALGGLYDSETETLTVYRMGLKRGLYVEKDQTYQVDLALDRPAPGTPLVELVDAPLAELDQPETRLQALLDLGWEGYVRLGTTTGTESTLSSPGLVALNGELADASFFFVGDLRGGEQLQASRVHLHQVTYTGAPILSSPMLAMPTLRLAPGATIGPDDSISLDLQGANAPDFFHLALDTLTFQRTWDIYLPGTSRSVRLPTFPSFDHLPPAERPMPYPTGRHRLRVAGWDFDGFDAAQFVTDLGELHFDQQLGWSYYEMRVELSAGE